MRTIYLLAVLFLSGFKIHSVQSQLLNCYPNQLGASCSQNQIMIVNTCNSNGYLYCSGGQYVVGTCYSGYVFFNGQCIESTNSISNIGINNGINSLNCLNGNNYQTFAYPGSSSYYYYCYNNQALVARCTQNSYYSTSAQACVNINNNINNDNWGQQICSSSIAQVDANNCQNYIQCVNGQYRTSSCPSGYYFNSNTQTCGTTIPINCNTNGINSGGNNNGNCNQNQIMADSTNCQNYIKCINGQYLTQSCPSGNYFNANTQQCGTTIPTTCNGNNNNSGSGTTNGNACSTNQMTVNRSNCQQYYVCQNGSQVSFTCPGGYYFDTASQLCGPAVPAGC